MVVGPPTLNWRSTTLCPFRAEVQTTYRICERCAADVIKARKIDSAPDRYAPNTSFDPDARNDGDLVLLDELRK